MNTQSTLVLHVSTLLLLAAGICPAETLKVDDIMYLDPEFPQVAPKLGFDPALKTNWLKALRRPESELKRLAADSIAIAKQIGVEGLDDTADDLLAVLKASSGDRRLQRAVARGLVLLDAREAADLLYKRRQLHGLGFSELVESALGRWGHEPMLREWRERLSEPTDSDTKLLLAINGLGVAVDRGASEALQRLTVDQQRSMRIRFAAARALGHIHDEGLVELARQLASRAERPLTNRLLAASLLARHDDTQAVMLLHELTDAAQPVVVAKAMGRLFEIDPQLIFDLAPEAIQQTDAEIRRLGARALIEKGDVESVQLLALLLDDHNPSIRQDVASGLFQLAARDELRDPVIAETTKMLAGDAWRGLEQACLVLGSLEHEPAADRLVELLEHERDEVMVSAAWALRRLRVRETLPIMLARANVLKDMLDGRVPPPKKPAGVGVTGQLSQLLQAFGEIRYREADSFMRLLVPKNSAYGDEPRAAAIWSLGYLYEGKAPEDLSIEFASRLKDALTDPEADKVRRQAAVSLGRMQSKNYVDDLRRWAEMKPIDAFVAHGCYWAMQQITGEPLPEVVPIEIQRSNWFLTPL